MKWMKNPEAVKSFLIMAGISAAGTAVALVWSRDFGLYTFLLCLLLLLAHGADMRRRYGRIAGFSLDINRILHGDSQIYLEKYTEGELGILQNEVYKMTVRLREQKQQLLDDKAYLADSLADISHQLRTPLTSINLLVSFLSEPEVSYKRRQELTRELYRLLSRIDWLITALLKMSKLDAETVLFQKETVSLEELVKKAVEPVLISMELKGQGLAVDVEGDVDCDMSWTCEAITNILKNCMEHTPDGGHLEVRGRQNAIYTEIFIRDDGKGIAKEDLPHVFERFYKGKNSSESSYGIGLALSRIIVASQGGTIKAENNPIKGAKFTIRFYKETV